jgi:hypothetical protein
MFPASSPATDLSVAIAAAQSRLASTSVGTSARTEASLAPSTFTGGAPLGASSGSADNGVFPPPSGFFTPLPSAGHDPGTLGESFAAGGVPNDLGVYSVFIMTSQMASDLCCGEVAGLKLCTAGRSTCLIRKHSKKVKALIGHIYIAGPRNSAFTQITLDPTLLPSAQLSQVLAERYSLDTWQALFGALNKAPHPLSAEDVESIKTSAITGYL